MADNDDAAYDKGVVMVAAVSAAVADKIGHEAGDAMGVAREAEEKDDEDEDELVDGHDKSAGRSVDGSRCASDAGVVT